MVNKQHFPPLSKSSCKKKHLLCLPLKVMSDWDHIPLLFGEEDKQCRHTQLAHMRPHTHARVCAHALTQTWTHTNMYSTQASLGSCAPDLLLRIEEYLPVPALKIVCRHWWVSLHRVWGSPAVQCSSKEAAFSVAFSVACNAKYENLTQWSVPRSSLPLQYTRCVKGGRGS